MSSQMKQHRSVDWISRLIMGAIFGLFLFDLAIGDYLSSLSVIVILVIMWMGNRRARSAYEWGWHTARAQLFASLGEAIHRGMTMSEWFVGELDREP